VIGSPECAVCGCRVWDALGRRTFAVEDADRADEYTKKRLRVLFEVWFPGAREVAFDFVLCARCGFVALVPRPDEEDVTRKYHFLAGQGDPGYNPPADDSAEALRAAQLFRSVRPFLSGERINILDYGGGNGRLLLPFAEQGHDCFVADYNEAALPAIRRLGATLDDIPRQLAFGLIVCSHVLEHLADPGRVVRALRDHLSDEGVAFFEVPVELWKGPPRIAEPVTHINFFAERTLRLLLERCGYSLLRSRTMAHADTRRRMVVARAVARRGAAGVPEDFRRGVTESRRLLSPSLAMRLRRAVMHPRDLADAAWNRIVLRRRRT
jgi:SAM-dependent methyltransferase